MPLLLFVGAIDGICGAGLGRNLEALEKGEKLKRLLLVGHTGE